MGIEKVLEKMSKLDYGTLLSTARFAKEKIMCSDYIRSLVARTGVTQPKATESLLMLIISEGIGTDGKFTENEKFFMSDLMGIDIKSAVEITKSMYALGKTLELDKLADEADDDTKAAIVQIICAVCACDGKVAFKETQFIKKLMEE